MQKIRDTRIDVFRALALLTIFINHVPGTAIEHYTIRNFGFADSAEVFVLISGMAVGLAYGSRFSDGNGLMATLKLWRRAGVLYCAHIMTTIATLTIFCAGALYFSRPDLLKLNNIGVVVEQSPEALVGIGLLGHQLGYNNILPLYAAILLAAPLAIWGARRNPWLTLGCSGMLWLLAGWFGWAPPNYPTEGVWFLNPLSWQFLFVIGIVATMEVKAGRRLLGNPLFVAVAAVYVFVAFFWIRSPLWGQQGWLGAPVFLAGFDKTFLGLPRLVHVLAMAYLVASIPALNGLARVAPTNALALLGKHSLAIFVFGTILAMIGQVLKATVIQGPLPDIVLLATGIALQFGLAYLIEGLKGAASAGSGPRPALQTDAPQRPLPVTS